MYLQSSINGGPSVNRLLATLPKNEYKRLLPELKTVKLALGEVLYKSGDAIKYVYFPNDSIISLISELSESSSLEDGMVGNEGMVGLGAFMGVNFSSTRALVQGAGTAMRMNSAVVRQEASRLGSLHSLLHRYSHSLLAQVSQSSACDRFHLVGARRVGREHQPVGEAGLEQRHHQRHLFGVAGSNRGDFNKDDLLQAIDAAIS